MQRAFLFCVAKDLQAQETHYQQFGAKWQTLYSYDCLYFNLSYVTGVLKHQFSYFKGTWQTWQQLQYFPYFRFFLDFTLLGFLFIFNTTLTPLCLQLENMQIDG